MTRLMISAALTFAFAATPALAQHSGIDTTTTAATDATIDATPPNLETGGNLLLEEGIEKPENFFEVEDAERAKSLADTGVEADSETEVDVEVVSDATEDSSASMETEAEMETDVEIEPEG